MGVTVGECGSHESLRKEARGEARGTKSGRRNPRKEE